MHGFVFAAGRGTRLRPQTDETPKPLLDVGSETLLGHCLRAVVEAGVDELVIVIGYRGDEIVDSIGDSYDGIPITFARQHEREGLADAAITAFDALGTIPPDVLAVNGDNVFTGDLSPLIDAHSDTGVDGTVLLDRVSRNEAETTALCDLEDDGTILGVESATIDRPDTGYIAGGAQTHNGADLLEACRSIERATSGEYELADALQYLVDSGRRYVGVELEGWHLNVNTPADLARARRTVEEH